MIKTHVIRKGKKAVAVVVDYDEYMRLKEIEQDRKDYDSAAKVKSSNRRWTSHEKVKKQLGL